MIPLRLEPYRKLFGIGELQYVDFARGWAEGLAKLLDGLWRQGVARSDSPAINPSWEAYRRRGAVAVREEPERLTSNWLRVASAPDVIRYFEPSGRVDRAAIARACDRAQYPTVPVHAGFLSFGTAEEVHRLLGGLGRFEPVHQWDMLAFKENGAAEIGLQRNDASNIVTSMFRQAWNAHGRKLGLFERTYAAAVGFHASGGLVKVGEKVPWGRQGDRRSSMLRNVAKGHVWEFGVTAIPSFWPYPHFRLKARVLFSPAQDGSGRPYDDHKKQHRLRRSVCKGWRNKQWHGRLMAFIELLSGESPFIDVPLSEGSRIRLDAAPILFSSPVRTALPNRLRDEDEEEDPSTLGRPDPDEET